MNLPKFIKDDERLFRLLLGDLFPSLELPVPEYGALQVSGVEGGSKDDMLVHPLLLVTTFCAIYMNIQNPLVPSLGTLVQFHVFVFVLCRTAR